MKSFHCTLITIILLVLMSSCQPFEIARCELSVDTRTDTTAVHCTANITDDGGFRYIVDKGYLLSFYPLPSHADTVALITSLYTETYELPSFTWKLALTQPDTVYYVRAYVKNNAGIGYSNIVRIKTLQDTLFVF